ncbi:MAG TPA: response regulator [Rhodocyclaceae bacterium]|nr:response regulator [Rhodocyclaceae bacterium]HRQ46018.1 response regulator [Rhodocyclaceae bacterium]
MNHVEAPAPVVVLVEDEHRIRQFVRTALLASHCQVFEAGDGERGLIETQSRKPDLVIVDLGLPDIEGMDLIRAVRHWSTVPILILSARSAESDKVAALDAGADDYLTKPFGVAELMARVRALLRRTALARAGEPPVTRFGEIEVDLAQRNVTRRGEIVHLTPIEYKLLALLVANSGRVLTHRRLLAEVWGPNFVEHSHYLRVHMASLRRKLEATPAFPVHILTETGIGYRLVT